jgi:hypothetical protein
MLQFELFSLLALFRHMGDWNSRAPIAPSGHEQDKEASLKAALQDATVTGQTNSATGRTPAGCPALIASWLAAHVKRPVYQTAYGPNPIQGGLEETHVF